MASELKTTLSNRLDLQDRVDEFDYIQLSKNQLKALLHDADTAQALMQENERLSLENADIRAESRFCHAANENLQAEVSRLHAELAQKEKDRDALIEALTTQLNDMIEDILTCPINEQIISGKVWRSHIGWHQQWHVNGIDYPDARSAILAALATRTEAEAQEKEGSTSHE